MMTDLIISMLLNRSLLLSVSSTYNSMVIRGYILSLVDRINTTKPSNRTVLIKVLRYDVGNFCTLKR